MHRGNRFTALWVALTAAALLIVFSSRASADCGVPHIYSLFVPSEGTVLICPSTSYPCPYEGGVLRENVDTGDAVVLADDCVDPEAFPGVDPAYGSEVCYIDECVPPGRYRYGYTRAECCTYCCYTDYYSEINVPPWSWTIDCPREHGTTEPTEYTEDVPWGNTQEMCRYEFTWDDWYEDAYTDPGPEDDVVQDTTVPDTSTEDESAAREPSSCGCTIPTSSTRTVFIMNALALFLGLMLLLARRGK